MSNPYAIFRVEKHRTATSLINSHINGDRYCQHADPARSHLNQVLTGSGNARQDVFRRIEESGAKVRPDSVLAIEIIMAATPGRFKNDPANPEWQAFCRRCIEFLGQVFGEDNVVAVVAQYDESNPHLHAAIVPVFSKSYLVGRTKSTEKHTTALNAKQFIGSPVKLQQLQNGFANATREFGLERGVAGSKAKHTSVKQFYRLANATEKIEEDLSLKLNPIDIPRQLAGLQEVIPRLVPIEQVKKIFESLNTAVEQINVARENTQTFIMQQIAGTALENLNIAGRKVATRDQKRLDALEKYLEKKHNEQVNWKTGKIIRLPSQAAKQSAETVKEVLADCTCFSSFENRLQQQGITAVIDYDNSQIWYKTGTETINGKDIKYSFEIISHKIAHNLVKGLESGLPAAVNDFGRGAREDRNRNSPVFFAAACRANGIVVRFIDDQEKEVNPLFVEERHQAEFALLKDYENGDGMWIPGGKIKFTSLKKEEAERRAFSQEMAGYITSWKDVGTWRQREAEIDRKPHNRLRL